MNSKNLTHIHKDHKTLRSLSALALCGVLLLQGCAVQPPTPPVEPTADQAKPEPVIKDKPFTAETFYALLVAEMAGSRERFDIALANYIQQAYKTRDPGVAARATHIARFLNINDATLSMAALWTELEPNNLEARFILTSQLSDSGRLMEAIPHSTFLLENGGTSLFQNIAARAARGTDTQREALIQEYKRLQLSHPENPEITIGLGLLYHQQNELEMALGQARSAIAKDDMLIAAWILEAQILNAQNKPGEAIESLAKLLQKHPKDTRLRLQYARLLTTMDMKAAQQQFAELVRQNPNDAEMLFSLALISKELGQLEHAQDQFETLLQYPERRSSAHYHLGKMAQDQQQPESALIHFSQVQDGPNYLPSLLQSTDILIGNRDLDAAHDLLSSARTQYPQLRERLFLIEAETLNNYQFHEESIGLLTEALEKTPGNLRMLYLRAMSYEQTDNLENMEKDLRSIIKYDPNNATAMNALGYTLANTTDRYSEAFDLINQALQLKPADAAVIDSMGWIQYRLGNYKEAILRLRQAMQSMPDHEIAAHLGEVLWVDGQKVEAKKVWQQGLELKPDSKIIPAVIKQLNADEP